MLELEISLRLIGLEGSHSNEILHLSMIYWLLEYLKPEKITIPFKGLRDTNASLRLRDDD